MKYLILDALDNQDTVDTQSILSVWLFVCLFVSNKCQNGWTDQAQILCSTGHDPREGLWIIKSLKICF